jgi:CubicO group peptidase (beta-lactamase class C family)
MPFAQSLLLLLKTLAIPLAISTVGCNAFGPSQTNKNMTPSSLTPSLVTSLSSDQKRALDQELKGLLTNVQAPIVSVSALAIKQGQVVYQEQFGRRYIADAQPKGQVGLTDRDVNAQTLFRIASVSKLVTTLGVAKLLEEGKLNLDEDVSRVLGWRLRNPNFPDRVITLRHLLTHRSSLTDGPSLYWWDVGVNLKEVLSPGGKLYKANEYWNSKHAAGDWFAYVNLNFGVIATVMERASGERFDKLMQRLVLQPLGIRGGFNAANFSADEQDNIATQYRKRRNEGKREVWDSNGPWVVQSDDFLNQKAELVANIDQYEIGSNGTIFGPQGRLRISLQDLGKLMHALINKGQVGSVQWLKPETIALLTTEQWRFNPNQPNGDTMGEGTLAWVLGFQRFVNQGKDRLADPKVADGFTGFGHYGDAYGLMATFVFDPVSKNGQIVILTGPGVNPDQYPAEFSTMYRWEEIANTAVYRRAILQR